jgi:uncharacterized protein YqfA (UPF0365 family)
VRLTVDVKYGFNNGRGWTRRKWVNGDGNTFEMISDDCTVKISMTISRESDLETAKAQLNMAIQDWRTHRAKAAKREHAGTVTNNLKRE